MRLGRYVQYVTTHDLPNKWTFPTYFLFLCHPDSDLFIKPDAMMRPFFKLLEDDSKFSDKPDSNTYAEVLHLAQELKITFAEYSPQDMVDIQLLMWVCAKAKGRHRINFENTSTLAMLKHILKIAPGRDAMYWRECRDGGYICIGWDETGDLSCYTIKEEFIEATREVFETLYDNPASGRQRSTKFGRFAHFRRVM